MLGKRLRSLREANGMTQPELAAELSKRLGRKFSGGAVGSWECERRKVTNDILNELADIFGCSTDYLMGRSETKEIQEDDLTSAIAGMFRAQKSLSEGEKKRLVTVLRAGWPELFEKNKQ